MDQVKVTFLNDVHMQITTSASVARELSEYFSFFVPGYKFMPAYRNRYWDGKIRLFDYRKCLLYRGLLYKLEEFCIQNNYSIEVPEIELEELTIEDAHRFFKSIGLPEHIELRDYQIETFIHCITEKRSLFVSPTASGKSLMIYLISRFLDEKTLIIVDSINLVKQMQSDFAEYGFTDTHLIHAGQSKDSDATIIISTWQSLAKQPAKWYNQFGLIIGDEAHKAKAKVFTAIMEKTTSIPYRFGFTGSLDESLTHQLCIEGLFGRYKKIVSTKDLQDQGHVADSLIKIIQLQYPEEEKRVMARAKFIDEYTFIVEHEKRKKFVSKLALSLKGNTLILFRWVDKHGVPMFDDLESKTDIPTYFVSGKVKGDDREHIRKIVNTHENSYIVASQGCFATGVNIPNINNMIFASSTKSKILVMQSLGRGLRRTETKSICNFYDICDDLRYKKYVNFAMKHLLERVKIYDEERHKYKIYKVSL